ncbi:protein argonaute 5-like [Vicia villosa]|uniref:protein argonaute 5-like n=1 Tax=Vicia villosa TaxID=3911 RepID=UPI00273CF2A9|nr:protein argonaute 5-like [Vicia villosa]
MSRRDGGTADSSSSGHPPPPSYAFASVTPAPSVVALAVGLSIAAPVVHPSLAAPVVRPSLIAPVVGASLVAAIKIPNRPEYGQLGRKIQVRVNHFQLQVANNSIHHYKVSFSQKIISKELCKNIINQLVKMYRESRLDNRILAYDGRNNLFTAGPLPFTSEVFVVNLTDENRGSSSDSDRKKRDRKFKVTIEFVSKTDLYSLTQFLRGMPLDSPFETIKVLVIALKATSYEKYIAAGSYYRGFHQSIRPTQMGLSLNIDVTSGSFYEPILVSEFVSKFFNLDLSAPMSLSDEDRVTIEKVLKGVKVKICFGEKTRRCKVTSLSREPLRDLTFIREVSRCTRNVIEYLVEKYDIRVTQPLLPALQVGTDLRPTYFPMELCQIEDGQIYSQISNENQVASFLRASLQSPGHVQRLNDIKEFVKRTDFNSNNVTKEAGLNVIKEPIIVDARILSPPTLKFNGIGENSIVYPSMGQWSLINKRFYEAGNVKHWSCISFSDKVNPTTFCFKLIEMCESKGMTFNRKPIVPITMVNSSQFESQLVEFDKNCKETLAKTKQVGQLQLLIVVLPDFTGSSYDRVKRVCETELGIISQCCQPQKAARMNPKYLESLALKINLKSGGRNMVLNDALSLDKRIDLVTDKRTIIFGADVTHYHQGENSCPSIAAVVASMDWPCVTKYRGTVSAQASRTEIIEDLFKRTEHPSSEGVQFGGMIRESLLAFQKSTARMPDRIIFYRDGVGERQFNEVLLNEMGAIKMACKSIGDTYRPTITFVVVIKRHHTRLFPVTNKETSGKSGNVMPGTVVDTSICHPRDFDFYLNSHAGIRGTSKPTRYYVLYDENNFTIDEFQTLTNNLCYTYARCNRSLSIVPPVYYAHLLAFRARSYISAVGNRNTTNSVSTLPPISDEIKNFMFYC